MGIQHADSIAVAIRHWGTVQGLAVPIRVTVLSGCAESEALTVLGGSRGNDTLGRVGAGEALGVARAAASQARGITEVRSGTKLNYGRAGSGRGGVVRSCGGSVANKRLGGIHHSPILIAGVAGKLSQPRSSLDHDSWGNRRKLETLFFE